METFQALLFFILLLPLFLAVVAFTVHISEYRANNRIKRWRATHIYHPDQLGNYPQYFNPENPRNRSDLLPGNGAYPETFLINNSLQKQIGKPKPPTTINRGDEAYSVSFLFPESATPAQLRETNFQPETTLSESEMVENMRRLKEKGTKQVEGIYAATGCKPGAGGLYDWAREVWRSLP